MAASRKSSTFASRSSSLPTSPQAAGRGGGGASQGSGGTGRPPCWRNTSEVSIQVSHTRGPGAPSGFSTAGTPRRPATAGQSRPIRVCQENRSAARWRKMKLRCARSPSTLSGTRQLICGDRSSLPQTAGSGTAGPSQRGRGSTFPGAASAVPANGDAGGGGEEGDGQEPGECYGQEAGAATPSVAAWSEGSPWTREDVQRSASTTRVPRATWRPPRRTVMPPLEPARRGREQDHDLKWMQAPQCYCVRRPLARPLPGSWVMIVSSWIPW